MARILIVDDDPAFREGLAETVHDLGHIAFEAGSCRAGLDMLEQSRADLVILDHRLGDADGLEFLRRMEEREEAGAARHHANRFRDGSRDSRSNQAWRI